MKLKNQRKLNSGIYNNLNIYKMKRKGKYAFLSFLHKKYLHCLRLNLYKASSETKTAMEATTIITIL